MYKLKWVYICDFCGKVALPELAYCGAGDAVKRVPSGWIFNRQGHLCKECSDAMAKALMDTRKEDV